MSALHFVYFLAVGVAEWAEGAPSHGGHPEVDVHGHGRVQAGQKQHHLQQHCQGFGQHRAVKQEGPSNA
jgi:hypothetical protein